MDQINKLWKEFKSIPYPNEAHIKELDLELLDGDIAGCVSTFIANKGKLDKKRIQILNVCLEKLEMDLHDLPKPAKEYFIKLTTLGRLVLDNSQNESTKNYVSKGLLQDKNAPPRKKGQPFFIRNKGEKVYSGFPLIPETETDGYIFGAITDFLEPDGPEGCITGDGYVQAPDGSRAGLVWQVYENGEIKISLLIEPNEVRWGVYNIGFPKPIKTLDDLVYDFRKALPLIKEQYNTYLNSTEL